MGFFDVKTTLNQRFLKHQKREYAKKNNVERDVKRLELPPCDNLSHFDFPFKVSQTTSAEPASITPSAR